jgi:hypothetical protein
MGQRYIFDVFDFRVHYTMQLGKEKEMLWRFCWSGANVNEKYVKYISVGETAD